MTVRDSLGRTVAPARAGGRRSFRFNPRSPGSWSPWGRGSRLVGADYFILKHDHLFPIIFPGARDLPAVSNTSEDMNFEMVLRLDPDVVFVSPDGAPDGRCAPGQAEEAGRCPRLDGELRQARRRDPPRRTDPGTRGARRRARRRFPGPARFGPRHRSRTIPEDREAPGLSVLLGDPDAHAGRLRARRRRRGRQLRRGDASGESRHDRHGGPGGTDPGLAAGHHPGPGKLSPAGKGGHDRRASSGTSGSAPCRR